MGTQIDSYHVFSLVLFLRPYVQCCRGVNVLSEAILLVTYIVTHDCFNKEIKTAS